MRNTRPNTGCGSCAATRPPPTGPVSSCSAPPSRPRGCWFARHGAGTSALCWEPREACSRRRCRGSGLAAERRSARARSRPDDQAAILHPAKPVPDEPVPYPRVDPGQSAPPPSAKAPMTNALGTTADSTAAAVLLDAHVHLHPGFSVADWLASARQNLDRAAGRLGVHPAVLGCLWLVDTVADRGYARLAQLADGGRTTGEWTIARTAEPMSLLA